MPRRNRVVVLGGTFDHLHAGHRAMLARAFRVGDTVGIGLATDAFVARRPKPHRTALEPYATRRRALTEFLGRRYPGRRWYVTALSDPWGRSTDREVEAIVLSEETAAAGPAIDGERRRLGLPPLRRYVVRLVRDRSGVPIRSRRIRSGEIDADGRPRRKGKASSTG